MSHRLIDPDKRFVELYVDELHWIRLSEIATEKGITIDLLIGCIFEHVLTRLKRISAGEVGETALRVEVDLEPIRDDKTFFTALIAGRDDRNKQQRVADRLIDPGEEESIEWSDL